MLHVLNHCRTTMTTWVPTAYRTHTLNELQANGADLLDTEVTVIGFMEANRGKGAICFVDFETGLVRRKCSSKRTTSARRPSIPFSD